MKLTAQSQVVTISSMSGVRPITPLHHTPSRRAQRQLCFTLNVSGEVKHINVRTGRINSFTLNFHNEKVIQII